MWLFLPPWEAVVLITALYVNEAAVSCDKADYQALLNMGCLQHVTACYFLGSFCTGACTLMAVAHVCTFQGLSLNVSCLCLVFCCLLSPSSALYVTISLSLLLRYVFLSISPPRVWGRGQGSWPIASSCYSFHNRPASPALCVSVRVWLRVVLLN